MVIVVKIDRDGVIGVRGKTKEDMDALPDSGTRRTLHLQDVATCPLLTLPNLNHEMESDMLRSKEAFRVRVSRVYGIYTYI